MKPDAIVQNIVILGLPVILYAMAARSGVGLRLAEIRARLGLKIGNRRSYVLALAAAVPWSLIAIFITAWTSSFKGSTIALFVDAPPRLEVITGIICYGILGSSFPEELLFRGLIAGALFRRRPFWQANLLQAAIFTLPHLLILLKVPRLWLLATGVPLCLGATCGWLRHSSGSILPAVIVHAASNIAAALAVLRWYG